MGTDDRPKREFSLERGLRRLAIWWRLGICTPLLYLAIGLTVKWIVFDEREIAGFFEMSSDDYRWLWWASVLVCLAISAYVVWSRTQRGAIESEVVFRTSRDGDVAPSWWQRYYMRTLTMLALSDLIAFLGLVLFLIQGDLATQAASCVLAWANYTLSKPATPSAHE